jgi:hypothetical protein
MTDSEFDRLLESALKSTAPQRDEAAVNRVLNRLAGPLPPQSAKLWRWPTVLLDWQFAPAWPRMAALGASLAVGFVIGISGLDRGIDHAGSSAANRDFGSLVFEPEGLTGGRP